MPSPLWLWWPRCSASSEHSCHLERLESRKIVTGVIGNVRTTKKEEDVFKDKRRTKKKLN